MEVLNMKLYDFRFVLTSGVVFKMMWNKELSGANSKKETINIRNEHVLTEMADMHLSIWISIIYLKYETMKCKVVGLSFTCSNGKSTVARITVYAKLTSAKPNQNNVNKYYQNW